MSGDPVGDNAATGARNRAVYLYRYTEKRVNVTGDGGPGSAERQTGVGHLVGRVRGNRDRIVRSSNPGNESAPVTRMDNIILQELDGKARVFDLAVGLGHFLVCARDVDVEFRQRGHHDQAERKGNHQFNQAEAMLAGASVSWTIRRLILLAEGIMIRYPGLASADEGGDVAATQVVRTVCAGHVIEVEATRLDRRRVRPGAEIGVRPCQTTVTIN